MDSICLRVCGFNIWKKMDATLLSPPLYKIEASIVWNVGAAIWIQSLCGCYPEEEV